MKAAKEKLSSSRPLLRKWATSCASRVAGLLPKKQRAHAGAVAEFFQFVHERQEIWLRKARGEDPPWTQDSILSKYVFCNVYRELDRGTVFLRGHLMRLNTFEEHLWCSIVYRLLNRVESFHFWKGSIPTRSDWPGFVCHLTQLHNEGKKIFSNAHQTMGLERYARTIEVVRSMNLADLPRDPRELYCEMRELENVGNFFAWQIVCDMLESKLLSSGENSFVVLGPGAKRGLERIFNDTSESHVETLRWICPEVFKRLRLDFHYIEGRQLTLKNIEHCLCEFEKYKNNMRGGRRFVSRAGLDANVVCRSCGDPNPDNDETLVLCDLCNTAFHIFCVEPPLSAVPHAEWLCSTCTDRWISA